MQSFELTKPVTSAALLKQFESKFGQTMNLEGLSMENLEDMANSVRTNIHTITDNLHFGKELNNNDYQKHQMMLDVLNQSIKEYGGTNMDPQAKAAAQGMSAQKKLEKGQALTPDERKTVAKVKRISKPFARKIQILTVVEQRAKVAGKTQQAAIAKRGKEAIRKQHGKKKR